VFGYARNSTHSTNVTVDGQTFSNWGIFSPDNFSADRLTASWTQDLGETSVTIAFDNNPQITSLILHSVTQEDDAVPEPQALIIFGLGLIDLGYIRRRKAV
jgi:hypothetical protein